jgi:protein phosphatase
LGTSVLRAFGLSDKGRVRPHNEDCFAIDEDAGLCVVADGMGGHNAGEIAAQLAVAAVVNVVRNLATAPGTPTPSDAWPFGYDRSLSDAGNLLRTAVQAASLQVLQASASTGEYAGMGTTIVVARVADGRLSVAHAGDSRLYVLAGGRLSQLTADDSWIASMLAEHPDTDIEALRHHPMRNALTNVLGASTRADVHVVEHPLSGGERLLLSTDGVHGVVDDRRLEQLLLSDDDPQTIADKTIRTALARGSRDNCTVVVADYRPQPPDQISI